MIKSKGMGMIIRSRKTAVLIGLGLIVVFFFAGCATIVEGNSDDVSITSEPTDAQVTIEDSSGRQVYTGRTPSTTSLEKGDGYFSGASYTVTVDAEGYEPQTVRIGTTVSGWYIGGNFLVGGIIGWLVVDPISGAMWRLDPRDVSATLSAETAQTEEQLQMHVVLLEEVPLIHRHRLKRVN